ncbi:DUF2164 domain-containing protein [Paenibacillus sp. 32352]|uniref:DUF2164 domain-containing protein n=1 Tax=Paenibacillus sp. 32352 TaxID=1969111 RepID=UPI0009AC7FF2|nr:DUF2164 domain-containing protein [Paenibacillus sp. 32352]
MHPIKLPKEHKQQIIASLQDYVDQEFSIEMGQLAGEGFLEFIMKELTPYIYNQALSDARKVVLQQMTAMEDEIYALEQPLPLTRRSQ